MYPNLGTLLAPQCWSYRPCLNHDRRPARTPIPNSTCLYPWRSTKPRAQPNSEGICHPSSLLTTPCTSLTLCSAEAENIQTFAETGVTFRAGSWISPCMTRLLKVCQKSQTKSSWPAHPGRAVHVPTGQHPRSALGQYLELPQGGTIFHSLEEISWHITPCTHGPLIPALEITFPFHFPVRAKLLYSPTHLLKARAMLTTTI